jgi:hypothetical protein
LPIETGFNGVIRNEMNITKSEMKFIRVDLVHVMNGGTKPADPFVSIANRVNPFASFGSG